MIGPFIDFLRRLPRSSISFTVILFLFAFGALDAFLDFLVLMQTSKALNFAKYSLRPLSQFYYPSASRK